VRRYHRLTAVETERVRLGIAFEYFVEASGDTCERRVFRPTTATCTGQDTTLPVTPGDEPVLILSDWNGIAAVPGTAAAYADVVAHLGLPRDTVAEWAVRHAAYLDSLATTLV